MANLPEFYAKEILKNTKYLANLSLTRTKIEVGDYGKVKNGIFRYKGKIKDKNEFKVNLKLDENISLPITSKSEGVSKTKLKTEVVAKDIFNVGINLNFKKKQGYFLDVTKGTKSQSLNNVDEVAVEIIRLYLLGKWDLDTVLIEEVVNGKYTTIIISAESNNNVALTGKGKLKEFSFIDLEGKIQYTSEKSLSNSIVAKKNYSHLFYGLKLNHGILKKLLGFEPKSGDVGRVEAFAVFTIPIKRKMKSGKIFKASDCLTRVRL